MTRRALLRSAGAGAIALSSPSWASSDIELPLPSGPRSRPMTTEFPQKGPMILQRTRPPLLETPAEVFDRGVFTPNSQFYVRWHWALIPNEIDVDKFKLSLRGHVNQQLSLSLGDLLRGFPTVQLTAVNQCSGNSRGFFQPRVPGGQWANGAMGNALWTGVRLRDVLDKAGVKVGALQVRFRGLEEPVVADAPPFMKSLSLDHARDGEVMIAFAMNGEQLPLVNGFPLRLVVPGWYATYWVKMLSDIEVLDQPDPNYWTKVAYTIPDTPFANMSPGETGVKMIPINRMIPRSFVTNLKDGQKVSSAGPTHLRGIAFGGDAGVANVDVSIDGGRNWKPTRLSKDEGKYSFRQWQADLSLPNRGRYTVAVRCTNANGIAQPMSSNWNPAGFMRNVVETLVLESA
ncbi:molybdopterin-dependent oxidoreductase [Bradyrhizobium elkanii]|uniref:molybdopterin-dependent oxidoreductase n=1 Tax=Bradyrhizobium elkanii TaxID=29448 RepID=UPI00216721BF|nr:molybdopterin-dependent oxidoreductase [Bradyrhizobium elkanii]